MGQRAGQPLSGILRKSVGLPPATARGASIRKNKLAADGSNPGMEDILPQTSASLADCPIAGLFGRDPDHGHDMRPALRTWLCMWDAETIDSLGAAGDLAVLLVLLDGGPLHLWLGDAMRREQVVLPGGVAAIGMGMPFRVRLEGPSRVLGFVFDEALIRGAAVPLVGRGRSQASVRPDTVPPPNAIGDLARVIEQELLVGDPDRAACRAALTLALLEFVAADPALVMRAEVVSTYTEARVERVIALIDDNISLDLPLGWLAREAGISPYHLSRSFRQTMGVNLNGYIRQRRMQAACRLLAETRKPLAEIAYDCGFSSQSRMTSVFRQALNTTPLAYRQACWNVGAESGTG
jgi:AraC family transcriptional regulator